MIKSNDFIKNATDSNNINNMVVHFFDELMVLYNIIGQREDIKVSSNPDNAPIICNLKMNNVNEAERLKNNLGNLSFNVFGSEYTISMTRQRNIVQTSISKTGVS